MESIMQVTKVKIYCERCPGDPEAFKYLENHLKKNNNFLDAIDEEHAYGCPKCHAPLCLQCKLVENDEKPGSAKYTHIDHKFTRRRSNVDKKG